MILLVMFPLSLSSQWESKGQQDFLDGTNPDIFLMEITKEHRLL